MNVKRLRADLQKQGIVDSFLKQNPEYSLVITGHSLGAGTSACCFLCVCCCVLPAADVAPAVHAPLTCSICSFVRAALCPACCVSSLASCVLIFRGLAPALHAHLSCLVSTCC